LKAKGSKTLRFFFEITVNTQAPRIQNDAANAKILREEALNLPALNFHPQVTALEVNATS
jgi:hypothetical protein